MSVPKKKTKLPRPKLQKVSEEMQQWAALLAAEVAQWPDASLRPMFGMNAFYRKEAIFGVVPVSFALDSPNTVMFKIVDPSTRLSARLESDPRVSSHGRKWWLFELSASRDLHDAIAWYNEAYDLAQIPKRGGRNGKYKRPGRNKRK